MKHLTTLALVAFYATPVLAEETRQLDAHEHGVGQLDIAFDGTHIAMTFHAPGADIVGFEYAAKSLEDRAKVDAAVATLARPLDLFALPSAASCSVVKASAGLESEEHEEHEDAHKHDDHDHEEHAEDAHEDHDAHAEDAGHTEFHAEYLLTCANTPAVTQITFAYFKTFENALEVEVQIIADTGARAFEVERASPVLDLRGMF